MIYDEIRNKKVKELSDLIEQSKAVTMVATGGFMVEEYKVLFSTKIVTGVDGKTKALHQLLTYKEPTLPTSMPIQKYIGSEATDIYNCLTCQKPPVNFDLGSNTLNVKYAQLGRRMAWLTVIPERYSTQIPHSLSFQGPSAMLLRCAIRERR